MENTFFAACIAITFLGYGNVYVLSEICWSDVCEYEMVIQHQRTMVYTYKSAEGHDSYVSNSVTLMSDGTLKLIPNGYYDNVEDLVVNASDVITADGITRNIITINSLFPGPTIEVGEGSQIVVRVTNKLLAEAISIHWHGIHQKYTPWMDGMPYITNCPIHPQQTFTYRFTAAPSGTHWYHSHMKVQRMDGLFGMMIVHKRETKGGAEIEDSVPLFVTDWLHIEGATSDMTSPYKLDFPPGTGEFWFNAKNRDYSLDGIELSALKYKSGLINGRGRFNNKAPLFETTIKSGSTKRFRTVNAAAEYPYRISIDGHDLIILSLDGNEIEPFTVQSIILFPGEEVDFKINGVQPSSKYWIRAKTLTDGLGSEDNNQEINAKLIYDGVQSNLDPVSTQRECSQSNPCKVLNCPFPNHPNSNHLLCIPISEMKDIRSSMFSVNDVYEEEFLDFDFDIGSSVNKIRFVFPSAPWTESNNGAVPCASDCSDIDSGCKCTHELNFKFNQVVRLTLLSKSEPQTYGHHPIHLHGFTFEVLKMGYPLFDETTGKIVNNPDIVCDTPSCSRVHWREGKPIDLNFNHPPRKDTILVPAGGYVIIQFVADNPGYWLLHCHSLSHLIEGMALVLNIAGERQVKPPKGFPTCNTFDWSSAEYNRAVNTDKAAKKRIGPKLTYGPCTLMCNKLGIKKCSKTCGVTEGDVIGETCWVKCTETAALDPNARKLLARCVQQCKGDM
ncbi:unnamed protein product [Owenia fusiformis]|uniref:Uncharacterized protein n=1 Tax=Owenia fusiformis TaxID=6347 RepID=A0A8S4P2U7_OWEFU|nr:unnamed protein product [Owenia fusiformis]